MICIAATIFAACNSDQKTDLETTKDVMVTDSAGLYNSNASADTANAPVLDVQPVAPVKTETKVIYVDRTPRPTPSRRPTNTNNTTQGTNNNGNGSANTTNDNQTVTTPTQPQKKEGWSNAAKGAVIGGVGGAISGAVISKKKGKGAVIGGVLGAAGGYIIGKKKDKKEAADTSQ